VAPPRALLSSVMSAGSPSARPGMELDQPGRRRTRGTDVRDPYPEINRHLHRRVRACGGRLVRIPWDLPNYGVDPDEFSVPRAVRASSAVPFAFEPVRVSGATWVDGGLLSNFPVQLFDSTDGRPRWPTFGIRLSAPPGRPPTHQIRGPLSLAFGALETLISDQDAAYVDDPCTVRRTIFVPAESVGTLDFDITAEERDALYNRGLHAAQQFLKSWDYLEYLRACRGEPTPDPL
jgi:NTE family protein